MKMNPESLIETAQLSGVAIDPEAAQRIARAMGPAIETFAPTAATLPFDCEPSGFRVAQQSRGTT